jgi:argininosuccinate lyase
MLRRAAEGQTSATALAERLVVAGVPFRDAHHTVGEIAREAHEDVRPLEDVAAERLAAHGPQLLSGLDPAAVAAGAEAGGGPGPASVHAAADAADARLFALRARTAERRQRWAAADKALDTAVLTLRNDA